MHADSTEAESSFGIQMLTDIKGVFEKLGSPKLFTTDLLEALTAIDEAPWGSWKNRGLRANDLARLLKPYGIRSTTVRLEERVAKGYRLEDFTAAWSRYPAPASSESHVAPLHGNNRPKPSDSTDEQGARSTPCNGVTANPALEEQAQVLDALPPQTADAVRNVFEVFPDAEIRRVKRLDPSD